MLQHLGSAVPKEDDYTEMICGPCTDSLPFLQYYLGHSGKKFKLNTFFLNFSQYLQMLLSLIIINTCDDLSNHNLFSDGCKICQKYNGTSLAALSRSLKHENIYTKQIVLILIFKCKFLIYFIKFMVFNIV